MENMVKITVNGEEHEVEKGKRLLLILTEKGIKLKTFEFESTLVFEKNNDGTCKRSIIVSAMPTENMNKFFKRDTKHQELNDEKEKENE